MSLYGYYHFGICGSGSAFDAFYLARSILGGIAVFMFLSVVWPESAKAKSAKIALGISCILLIGSNLFAIAHPDLVRSAPAIRIFCLVNGQLIGLSVSLAVYLWLRHKKARGEQNGNSKAGASEFPDESGREPN
jgi:hypothetical protein